MKYLIFGTVFGLGVPGMTLAAAQSARVRGWLLAVLIFSTVLGDVANINFASMEYYRGPERGFEVSLTDLIAWALVGALLLRASGKLRWLPYNSLWMLAFFGVACLATAMAEDRLLACFTLFKFARMYVVFWCVANCLRLDREYRPVWMGMAAISALMTAIALKQKYVDGIFRIYGPFDHSNTIPSFLILIIPVLLMWGLGDRRLRRAEVLISLAGVLGMLFAVIATLSRAGLLVAAGSVLGVLVAANARAYSGRVAVTSLLVCVGALGSGLKAADTLIERFRDAPQESAEAREEFNVAAGMMVRDHFLGVGLNNFSLVLTQTPEYRQHFRAMAGEQQAGVAHQIYLLTAAEMGYPGLVLFLVVIGRFGWLAAKGAWRSRSLEGLLLFAFALGFCGLYALGFLEWTLRISPVTCLFVIAAGVCAALAEIAQAQAVAARPARAPGRRGNP